MQSCMHLVPHPLCMLCSGRCIIHSCSYKPWKGRYGCQLGIILMLISLGNVKWTRDAQDRDLCCALTMIMNLEVSSLKMRVAGSSETLLAFS